MFLLRSGGAFLKLFLLNCHPWFFLCRLGTDPGPGAQEGRGTTKTTRPRNTKKAPAAGVFFLLFRSRVAYGTKQKIAPGAPDVFVFCSVAAGPFHSQHGVATQQKSTHGSRARLRTKKGHGTNSNALTVFRVVQLHNFSGALENKWQSAWAQGLRRIVFLLLGISTSPG